MLGRDGQAPPGLGRDAGDESERDHGGEGHGQAEGAGESGGMGHTGKWYKAQTSRSQQRPGTRKQEPPP